MRITGSASSIFQAGSIPFSIVVNSEDVKDIIYDMVGDMKKACNEIKIIDKSMMFRNQRESGKDNDCSGDDEMNIIVGGKQGLREDYNNFVV